MSIYVDGFLRLFVDVSIKAAILACIAGLVLLVLRVRNANLQHRVWTTVLAAMLALPLLVYLTPSVPVPIAIYPRVAAPNERSRSLVSIAEPEVVRPADPTVINDVPMPRPALSSTPSDVVQSPIRNADALPASRARNLLPWLVLAVYLAGVCWFAVRLAIGVRRARLLLPAARSVDLPSTCQQLVAETAVRQSSQVRVPLTVGWRRATILLPMDWSSWDHAMLTAALSHELEHVRRRDQWIGLGAELNRALYWFHPVAWFLRRRLSTLAEQACDDAVVASLGDRAGYARHLLAVAARLTAEPWRLGPAGVAMARTPRVEHRINAILDSSRPLARQLSIATALAIVAVAVPLALLAAGLTGSDKEQHADVVAVAEKNTAPSKAESATVVTKPPAAEAKNQVRGRVLMRSDGKPVANAAVLIFSWRDNGTRIESKRTKSNAAGEFVFENIESGPYQLVASIDDYSSRHAQFKGEPVEVPIAGPVTLKLDKMPSIAIQVVAKSDGKPIQDAVVRPAYGGHDRDQRTDDGGKAVLKTLTHEVWNIEVEAKGFAKQQQAVSLATSESADIKFELQPGGGLFGTIKDDAGKPLAGAGVSVFTADYVGGQLAYMRTNGSGHFRFEYLPLGRTLELNPSKQGYLDGRVSLTLQGPAPVLHEVNLVLKQRPPGGSVAGTVSDSQGKPIAGAVVSNRGRASRDSRTATTDSNGNYRLDDVFEDSIGYELIAKAKGFAPQRLKFKPGTADAPGKLAITMEAGHRIRGRVVDEASKPIRGARVYFSDGDRGGNMEFGGGTTTDADGRFAFDSLPKRSPFNISADGYSEIEGAKLTLDGDEEVVVSMKSEGVIRGQVIDAATSKAIARFNIQITFSPDRTDDEPGHHLSGARSTTPEGERFANADGTFLIKDLIRDMPLQVTVIADGYERKVERRVVAAAAADANVVEFRLDPINPSKFFTIRGQIVDGKNQPVAGAQLQFISARELRVAALPQPSYVEYPFGWQMIRSGNTASAAGLKQLMKAVSGPDGTFEFKDVQPAPEMQVVYWGDGLSQGRLENIEKLSAEEREKIVVKTITPATIRGVIDRKAFPDVTSIEVSSFVMQIDDDWFNTELSATDTSYEIRNVPPGKYILRIHGARSRNQHPDGFDHQELQRRSIEVKSGETLTFDIKATTNEK